MSNPTNSAGTIQSGSSWYLCGTPGCSWQGSQPCPFHSQPAPTLPTPTYVWPPLAGSPWPYAVEKAATEAWEAVADYYRALTAALHDGGDSAGV